MLNYKLFAVLAFILTSGILYEEAYAGTLQPDNYPMVPDAFVNYDSVNNESTITWDFSALPDYTDGTLNGQSSKCALKVDYAYNNNPETDADLSITSFQPINYNPTTVPANSGTILTSISWSVVKAVEIPCTGQYTIDFDAVMNNAANDDGSGGSYVGVEPFISFYRMNSDGNFNSADVHVVDEILIMYHPQTAEISQVTVDWACGANDPDVDNQIAVGNILFIDQSGIRGTGGPNNCNTVLELQSEDYCCTFPTVNTIVKTNGGSDDDHNSRPTFGFDHKTFVQRVDHGLVINDNVYTVTDNFWTPMPMLSLHVGATQNFTATTFAPHQLKILEFAFGIPEVGKWHDKEASIEIETNYDGEVLSSKIVESYYPPILNATSLEYSVSKVKCVADDNTEPCYRVSVEFSFLEAPIGNVFGLQAIDNSRKNQILYFNDGITLEGDSQNPPVTKEIISEIKYKGLQTIQRIDKENNIWMTLDEKEPVALYKQNDHGTFIPLEIKMYDFRPIDAMTSNPDRLHSEFPNLIKYEENRAIEYFDSTLLVSELGESWSYDYTTIERMDKINDDIELEKIRILEVYEQLFTDYEKTIHNFEQ